MRILRDYQFIAPEDRGASAAIGNFDGVHLGHRAVIDLARDRARAADAPLGVVTFEPHPREFFAPDAAPFRLMNAEAKANRLAKLGVERLFELNFTAAPLLETGGIEVSSTRIREALSAGRPDLAARMLGHHHRIEGAVIRGDQRGRLLGYPTANMSIAGLHPPRFGIYAVQVDVLTGPHSGRRHGVASVGTRPTFGEHAPNIETFLFDFRGDLYGEHLSVALIEFLRPEQRFPSPEALVAQMDRDSAAARDALAARAPARPV